MKRIRHHHATSKIKTDVKRNYKTNGMVANKP